ncbi:MAG: BatA domain-containing protein, partial [Beijerinckiaceae bacterium]|nr:BatA domain-containing protein [Beijerinckiaceae bacterium]
MAGFLLAFDFPAVLAALASLPLLYLLLRITPPHPAHVPFPPLRLILGLRRRDETASRTPWWLLILRLAIAACIVFAMSGPLLNPPPGDRARTGPLLVVLDDGWPAAPSWDRRISAAARIIEAAERNSRIAALVAASDSGRDIVPAEAAKALNRLRALKPVPFVPDRMAVIGAVEKFSAAYQKPEVVWIADGLARGHAMEFASKLSRIAGNVTLVTDLTYVRALAGAENQPGRFDVRVLRASPFGAQTGVVRALDRKGLQLGEAVFDFAGSKET